MKIKFEDGIFLKRVEQAKYLGGNITQSGDAKTEVEARIAIAAQTMRKLKDFWNKTNCTRKWKAMISQLIYGLETLPLTSNLVSRFNAFQMKGFRKILKISHSYYSRVSNAEIITTLNQNADEAKQIKIKTVAEMINEKKLNLLGHCIRADLGDPMRQPFLKTDSTMYINDINRRAGHPRNKWHKETFELTWKKLQQTESFDYSNFSHQQKVIEYHKR